MSSKHLPLIAWPKREIEGEIFGLERRISSLRKELQQRGDRDERAYGFPLASGDYRVFRTAPEAYNAAGEYFNDKEGGPYKVHRMYLPSDFEWKD